MICVVLGREWMLYYICPLHTVFFLLVWAIARLPPTSNSTFIGVGKAILSLVLLFLFFQVLDCVIFFGELHWSKASQVSGLFEAFFNTFGDLFLRNGSLTEWHFRFGLDLYSSSLGILIACFIPAISTYFEQTVVDRFRRLICLTIALTIIIAWMVIFYPMDKTVYNMIHPFVGCIPMFAYLIIRNIWPSVRNIYMPMFQFIGTITLETYLLQLHLYMVSTRLTFYILLSSNSLLFSHRVMMLKWWYHMYLKTQLSILFWVHCSSLLHHMVHLRQRSPLMISFSHPSHCRKSFLLDFYPLLSCSAVDFSLMLY